MEKNSEITDIGGKYMCDDCNIFETIRRELYEETYGTVDLRVTDIKEYAAKYGIKYVCDFYHAPVYAAICIPIGEICDKINLNVDEIQNMFNENRRLTLSENPNVPEDEYKPIKLEKIKRTDIYSFNISGRLKKILKMFNKDANNSISHPNTNKPIVPNNEQNTSKLNNCILNKKSISDPNNNNLHPVSVLDQWYHKNKFRVVIYSYSRSNNEWVASIIVINENNVRYEFEGKHADKKFAKKLVAEMALKSVM
jgi:hypothetical protein